MKLLSLLETLLEWSLQHSAMVKESSLQAQSSENLLEIYTDFSRRYMRKTNRYTVVNRKES